MSRPAHLSVALAFALGGMSSATALAGGPARTNPLSARATGMGGAYAAVADDPTALHFNPAGMAFGAAQTLLVSLEAISSEREYRPGFADDRCADPAPEFCVDQATENGIAPLPSLGYSHRPSIDGVPSRLTVGIGAWATFGGVSRFASFEDDDTPALEETTSLAIEVVPGFSYEVNDRLAIGAALRVSLGSISLVAKNKPIDADLSGAGIGVGGTLGIVLKPTDRLSVGAVYRTSLTNSIDGDGEVDFGTSAQSISFDFEQQWPQSAALGVAVRAAESLLVSAQVDWTNWSRLNAYRFEFPTGDLPTQTFLLDWNDNIIARLGAEIGVSDALVARLGAGYDSRVIPDRTTDRALSDGHAFFGTAGVSVAVASGWTVDASFEYVDGPSIEVPDNSAELGDVVLNPPGSISPETAANPAPGVHDPRTLALTVGFRFVH